ncbi:MAG: metallophosphoesterase [Flavobacteriales bacterium]|nr:metallophosphoesterase [Flavobacteriales bacterium]
MIFLVGDAGEPEAKTFKVFDALLKQVKPIEEKSTIIFLGDNIYPGGMPNKTEKGRVEAEEIILYQLNRLKQSKAKTYYIPGNHDWNKGKKNGLSHVLNEEKFIEEGLDDHSFIPSNGCPGPVDVAISDNLVLIAIDTQWWLHQYEKSPIRAGDCKEITTVDVIKKLKVILAKNEEKHILIVGHHPLMSKGEHGGFRTLKSHIFPLTNLNKNLYLPLPILGSFYPLYRSWIGNIQDLAHPKYKKMIKDLQTVFEEHKNLIYAAGHEHNLQYYNEGSHHYIVSGSGSKLSDVKKLKSPNFSAKHKGYFKLSYLKNGSILIDSYGIVEGKEKLLFRKRILSLE